MTEQKFSPMALQQAAAPADQAPREVVYGFLVTRDAMGVARVDELEGIPPPTATELAYTLSECLSDANVARAREEIEAALKTLMAKLNSEDP